MSYKAIVTRLKNVRPHPNADRVQLATCHGNQVVVGLDSLEDHWGVYFPSDGQLSHEFCHANNLYRHSELNKFPEEKGGMFDDNRRVRAQKFRGEISDGFWVPLHNFGFIQVTGLAVEGFEFDEWQGVPICTKYINPATVKIARENQGKKTRTAKSSVMFKEHFDTGHFGKNLHEYQRGHHIIITEKLHGTSGRIGHVQLERDLTTVEKIAKFFGAKIQETEWKYLNGTRRVVLEESSGSQYHDPTIRDKAFKIFNGNLRKGETVYFEIVGYESTGASIMPSVDTKGLGDKNFTKTYGERMPFSYGCEPTQSEVYVYRITFANEDGQSIDYAWEDVVKRCNEIGVKHVPHLTTLTLGELEATNSTSDDRDLSERFARIVESLGSGPSQLDSRHIKEGVCVRIEGGINNRTYKFKSFEFKVLEGIVKDSGVVDTEEAQG
jgi:RNA ligase (TIGR02306 family)